MSYSTFTLRLAAEDKERLQREADRQSVGVTELARRYLLAGLAEDEQSTDPAVALRALRATVNSSLDAAIAALANGEGTGP